MKVPEPQKLPSGNYFIRMRLNGVSVPVTRPTAKECKRAAELIKAEYRANKREIEKNTSAPTLYEAFDSYIAERSASLSPSTIRFYRIVQKNRFQSVMNRRVDQISQKEWQAIVNQEAKKYNPKTLRNSYGAVKSVIHSATGQILPEVTFPGEIPAERGFLSPDEIPKFVAAVKDTKYAVPLLLALSSMRISEIQALDWKDIPIRPDFIRVSGAVVLDENNNYQRKLQNKNKTSTRNVPILIPELSEAIERDRKPNGSVMPCTQNNLREACRRICQQNGFSHVTPHGLRHSFASLAYHLGMPEQIAMEIGGWSDAGTMRKIYTHIAQSDISRYKNAMADFYKNANENANGI